MQSFLLHILTSRPKADNFYMLMDTIEKNPDGKEEEANLTFHWSYIILPLGIMLLMAALTAIFYPQLTDEIAYRFDLQGAPKSWLGREALIPLTLLPQFLLFAIALFISWGITRASRSVGELSSTLKPEGLLLLMGNLVALPQIIFGFVMLDVFIYNIRGNHLMPIWLFALIMMIIGGIILAAFFIQAFKRARSANS